MTPEKECIIDIDRNINTVYPSISSWVSEVKNELENRTENSSKESEPQPKQSIYRVPSSMKDLHGKAYRPQMVSIGPYHHGEQELEAMEEHKYRALIQFLARSGKPLESYLMELGQIADDITEAYEQLDERWKRDTGAFLRLMMVDGCFVLELMRTTTVDEPEGMGYADNDPVFSRHGKISNVPFLRSDMLLLENQLPLSVLTTLFAVEEKTPMSKDDLFEVKKLILGFLLQPHTPKRVRQLGECLHILDVSRKSLLSEVPLQKTKRRWRVGFDQSILSATMLDQAGVRIKVSRTTSLKSIKFQGGVLELPLIVVDDTFESEYLNLMAFERFHVGAGSEVMSFVFFMSCIIYNPRDVDLLIKRGIIVNAVGSNEDVDKLFKSLSRDLVLDPHSKLGHVGKLLAGYCRRPWRVWRAELIREYFPSKRAELSAYLFVLTVIQTVFGVLSYRPK